MTTTDIKKLRSQRAEVEKKIDAAKVSRRKAANDAEKAKFTTEIETLRNERKKIGTQLRTQRASA